MHKLLSIVRVGVALETTSCEADLDFAEYADACKQADSPVKGQKLTGSSNSAMGVAPGVLGVASLAASALAIML